MNKRKKKLTLYQKRVISGYLFISPIIIGFLMFMVKPLIESFQMSLSNVKLQTGSGGFILEFVGLENYKKAFTIDPEFTRLLTEEIVKMVTEVPAILIFSFIIALLLNQKFKGRGLVRAIFFLPVILSSGIIVGLEENNVLLQQMQSVIDNTNQTSITGVLSEILIDNTGVTGGFIQGIFDIVNRIYDIAKSSGIQIIIFLTALQGISISTFEAARIEGCTAWECFWKITLPMVSPLILVNFVYTVVDFFIASDSAVMTKITNTMMSKLDYGFSSAMAWVYFLVIMAFLGICSFIISKKVYYYE